MKISVDYNKDDALARYLASSLTTIWLQSNIDGSHWSIVKSAAGKITFTLKQVDFDTIESYIESMSRGLWPTPNQWEQQFVDDLRKVLKKARNARGTHAKKYRD